MEAAPPPGRPKQVARRTVLGAGMVVEAASGALLRPAAAAGFDTEWSAFRARFLGPDGRIIDTGNAGISHSEGQGWGLLMAVAARDRRSFDLIWNFTRTALRRPGDRLHAWKWDPAVRPHVPDPNNATDGDLYIAWGLARGATLWNDADLAQEARAIGRDILRVTLRTVAGWQVLLPGAAGFEPPGALILNPSYAVIPAWRALHVLVPDPAWARLEADQLSFLRRARFGVHNLSPDWVQVARADGALSLPSRWPPRFSFDAVRVPLLLAWGGHATHEAAQAASAFWAQPHASFVPAWVDLRDGTLAEFGASPGVIAVQRLLRGVQLGQRRMAPIPAAAPGEDYYSSSLRLLVMLAANDLLISTY